MTGASQEMTLKQWVERLPSNNLAHKEYGALTKRIAELKGFNRDLTTCLEKRNERIAELEGK